MGGARGDGSGGGIMTVAVSTASKSMACAKRARELRCKSSLRMGGCYIKEHELVGNLSIYQLRWGLVNVHSSTWFRVISV